MKIEATQIPDLFMIHYSPASDDRGRFTRLFCESALAEIRPKLHFCQINLSETKLRGTVRGMHYQTPPATEAKLVQCLRGRVFDVAVDLRADSPTFLHWYGTELSEATWQALFIPEGFAHGFQTLTDDAQLLYMHTAEWNPQHEAGLRHNDPKLAIHWPLPVTNCSQRDKNHPLINDDFIGVHIC